MGIAERFDELVDLGVTAIYLTPVFSSASNHRYHAYDYLHVDPLLGGDAAFRALLDAAHRPRHAARPRRRVQPQRDAASGRSTTCSRPAADSPYRDWFVLDPGRRARPPWPACLRLPRAGPRLRRCGYSAWWGHPALPKLNVVESGPREYLLAVAEHWLRFGIDGWRLDVPTDDRGPGVLAEFRDRCRRSTRGVPGRRDLGRRTRLAGRRRFDGLMNYPLGTAILGFAGGAGLDLDPIAGHHLAGRCRPRRAAFAAALEQTTQSVRRRRRAAAQPDRQPRHAAGPTVHVRRPGRSASRSAAAHASGRAVDLLRRRDRHARRRPREPGGLPAGGAPPSICAARGSVIRARAGNVALRRHERRPRCRDAHGTEWASPPAADERASCRRRCRRAGSRRAAARPQCDADAWQIDLPGPPAHQRSRGRSRGQL